AVALLHLADPARHVRPPAEQLDDLRIELVHLLPELVERLVGHAEAPPVTASCKSAWSARTSAVIASTIGTARGSTHGSWRPRPLIVVSSCQMSTVFCSRRIVAVGLNATRK